MNFSSILHNQVFISMMIAWMMAQILKLPLEYLRTRRWNWALLVSVGGMPSSHSALMASTTQAVGLFNGFDTPVFAVSLAISMIVIYDATGIRRQAGIHAQRINMMFVEIFRGHPLDEEALREVLGHTPLEVVGGTLLGIAVPTMVWLLQQ
ncbi:MAG: divergent PAP2 family protein [Anaerolineales bacterium]|nr:divergent PAP2 family protein [Anaerolineales bacterium]